MLALSIRQPWAWFLANGLKDVENRTWATPVRGWVQIHAAKKMSDADIKDAIKFALQAGCYKLPRFEDLHFGGIIGIAKLTACVRRSRSRWFAGPYGFVFQDAYPLPFVRCAGELGFFEPSGW